MKLITLILVCLALTGCSAESEKTGKQTDPPMAVTPIVADDPSALLALSAIGAKTKKELWLQGLMQRRGNRCAAVALANKTVRTAYSMLQNNTEYHAA